MPQGEVGEPEHLDMVRLDFSTNGKDSSFCVSRDYRDSHKYEDNCFPFPKWLILAFLFLKIILLVYLVFGCAGSLWLHAGFLSLLLSCWGALVVVACGLRSGSSQALEHRLSVVGFCVTHVWHMGLVAPRLVRNFLDPGSNPCLLYWQAGSLPLSHQESPNTYPSFPHPFSSA